MRGARLFLFGKELNEEEYEQTVEELHVMDRQTIYYDAIVSVNMRVERQWGGGRAGRGRGRDGEKARQWGGMIWTSRQRRQWY